MTKVTVNLSDDNHSIVDEIAFLESQSNTVNEYNSYMMRAIMLSNLAIAQEIKLLREEIKAGRNP